MGLVVTDILEHHGTKGMKWGVRKSATTRPVVSFENSRIKYLAGPAKAKRDANRAANAKKMGRTPKVSESNVGGKKAKVLLKVTDKGKVTGSKGGEHSPSSHDAARATAYSQIAKKSGTHALSNAELQHLVNRMNLEQNYSRIASTKSSPAAKGAKFAAGLVANVGKQQANAVLAGLAAKQVAKFLAKAAL